MTERRWTARLSVVALAALAAAPEWKRGCTRPGELCGVPLHPYTAVHASPPTAAGDSFSAVLLAQPVVTGPAGATVRQFQLAAQRLQVDHCMISDVALQLREDGLCVLTLRADQNPVLAGGPTEAVTFPVAGDTVLQRVPARTRLDSLTAVQAQLNEELQRRSPRSLDGQQLLQTGHLRRNAFRVRVMALGGAPVPQQAPNGGPGAPVLFTVEPPPFMVERGEPLRLNYPDPRPDVKHLFPLVDRVRVEFSYQR